MAYAWKLPSKTASNQTLREEKGARKKIIYKYWNAWAWDWSVISNCGPSRRPLWEAVWAERSTVFTCQVRRPMFLRPFFWLVFGQAEQHGYLQLERAQTLCSDGGDGQAGQRGTFTCTKLPLQLTWIGLDIAKQGVLSDMVILCDVLEKRMTYKNSQRLCGIMFKV